MSFDLTGYRALPGETPDDAMERLEQLALAATTPSDAVWAEIERVGALLAAVDASAEVDRDRAHGYVEVSTPRFQVSVHADEAAVTIPYWSDGTDESFEALPGYLRVLREAGFTMYDPQNDVVVDETSRVGDGYRASAAVALPALHEAVSTSLAASTPAPRRRWWSTILRTKEH